jgi:nucleoside-diphosphate-sugar epimerase
LQGEKLADYAANIEGVENVISAINDCGTVVKTVFASSMLVCKVGYIPYNYDEYLPSTIYGESKVISEKIIKNHPCISCGWTIVRPSSIWGPWFGEPYRRFFEIIMNRRYVNINGNACKKTYGFIGNTVFQIDRILFACDDSLNKRVFYLGDIPPINISEWADEIRAELKLRPSMKVPFSIFRIAALCGDFFAKLGYKFPMTSFRLKNMTTDNILNLNDLNDAVGVPPFSRKEGIQETLKWFTKVNHDRDMQ